MNTLCKLSLVALGHVTKILQAENGQKVYEFESILMKNGLWFLSTLSTTFFLVTFVYPNSKTFFLRHLLYFFFLFLLSTFKPLNALYSKFERLKISGRTSVRLKSGVPGWGDPPQLVPPNFKLLIC